MRTKLFFILLSVWAAATAARTTLPLTADAYLRMVLDGNMGLACERLNVEAAQADAVAARVFNDPTLSVEYADNDDRRMQMGRSVSAELGYTLSPGKRGARVRLAESERELAAALLGDYLRNLRLEALTAYWDAMRLQMQRDLAADNYELTARVARGDSLRLALGDISETDAMQSALDARMARAEMLSAQADYFAACMTMNTCAGVRGLDTVCAPARAGLPPRRSYDLGTLVASATEGRADILAALKNADVARRALAVERKERNMDFDLALGYNYNTEVRNEIAPAPRFSGVSVGVSIPLKFSNSNRGAVDAARIRARQAEMQYDAACTEIGHEVAAALFAYEAAYDALDDYSADTLTESDEILARYAGLYARGDVSLIEFKEMRQAQTDLRMAYIDALCNCGLASATLAHATGQAAE